MMTAIFVTSVAYILLSPLMGAYRKHRGEPALFDLWVFILSLGTAFWTGVAFIGKLILS